MPVEKLPVTAINNETVNMLKDLELIGLFVWMSVNNELISEQTICKELKIPLKKLKKLIDKLIEVGLIKVKNIQ